MFEPCWPIVRLQSTWRTARWSSRRSRWTSRHGSQIEPINLAELYLFQAREVQRWWWFYDFGETYILEEIFCDVVFWNFSFVEHYVLDQIYGNQGFVGGYDYARHYGFSGV